MKAKLESYFRSLAFLWVLASLLLGDFAQFRGLIPCDGQGNFPAEAGQCLRCTKFPFIRN